MFTSLFRFYTLNLGTDTGQIIYSMLRTAPRRGDGGTICEWSESSCEQRASSGLQAAKKLSYHPHASHTKPRNQQTESHE